MYVLYIMKEKIKLKLEISFRESEEGDYILYDLYDPTLE